MSATHGGDPASPDPPPQRVAGADGVVGVWSGTRRPPEWAATLGIAVLVAIVAAAGLAAVAREVVFTPGKAVTAYFAALAAHDATALPDAGERDLVAAASYVPPESVTIDATHRDGGYAQVDVTYLLAGRPHHVTVAARRSHWWGPWSTDGVLSGVEVLWAGGVGDADALIDGRPLADGARLHPGVYAVTVAEHPVYEADPVSLTVPGDGETVTVPIALTVKASVTQRLQRLIDTYLSDCAASAPKTSTVVADCPLRLTGIGAPSPEDVTWTITASPRVSLVIGAPDPLQVVTATPGAATLAYTQGGGHKTATVPIEVSGWVDFRDGRMVWHRDNITEISE